MQRGAVDDVREVLKAVERRAMDESLKSNARITALAAQVNEVISGMQGFDMRLTGTRERLTALEQAQRPPEEARLRDAVVEAALAWFSAGEDLGPGQKQESMMTAIVALRAHRAKKGGA